MYLHAAANGSRTYGRTGLKCQNGWHALCGMAPTLWSSIRHVDQHGNIARRERLCLWVLCDACRRVPGRYALFTKFDRVHCTRETRNRYSWCWAGAAPAGARGQRPDKTSSRERDVAAPVDVFWTAPWSRHLVRIRGRRARIASRADGTTPSHRRGYAVLIGGRLTESADNILYSKCLLLISFKTLHQRFHHALER